MFRPLSTALLAGASSMAVLAFTPAQAADEPVRLSIGGFATEWVGYARAPTINVASLAPVATYAGTNPDLLSLTNAVNALTRSADIEKAGAQLRPEANGGTRQAALGATTQALNMVAGRSDDLRSAQAEQTGLSSGDALAGFGVWGQGFGSTANQDKRAGIDGYGADTAGLAFGGDTLINDDLRAGLSIAYAHTAVADKGTRDGSGQKIASYLATLYGSYSGAPWYLDASLSYGLHRYDSTRLVDFLGAPEQVAKASFSGRQYGGRTEVGYPLATGPAVVTPLASLAYNHLSQDGYSESGAPGADLTVGGSSGHSLRSGLGAKTAMPLGPIETWQAKANARAVWLHEFNATAPDQTSSFVAGGSAFTTPGMRLARESFDLGVGLDLLSGDTTTLSAKYDLGLSDRFTSHTGSLQVRSEF